MMKRRYMIPLLILVVLGIAYWAGPRLPRTELNTDLPDLPVGIDRISEYVQDREARLPVKPDNQESFYGEIRLLGLQPTYCFICMDLRPAVSKASRSYPIL